MSSDIDEYEKEQAELQKKAADDLARGLDEHSRKTAAELDQKMYEKILADITAAGGRGPGAEGTDPRQQGDIIQNRRNLGYLIGLLGVAGVVFLIWRSFCEINELTQGRSDKLVIAGLVAHGIVAVAGVFFCYQLIRAGERMLFPHWWLSRDVEVAKVMLGITDPVSQATKILQTVAPTIKK